MEEAAETEVEIVGCWRILLLSLPYLINSLSSMQSGGLPSSEQLPVLCLALLGECLWAQMPAFISRVTLSRALCNLWLSQYTSSALASHLNDNWVLCYNQSTIPAHIIIRKCV